MKLMRTLLAWLLILALFILVVVPFFYTNVCWVKGC